MSGKEVVKEEGGAVLDATMDALEKFANNKRPKPVEERKVKDAPKVEVETKSESEPVSPAGGESRAVSEALRRRELEAAADDFVASVRGVSEFVGKRDDFVDPVREYRERVMRESLAPGEGEGLPYGVPNPQNLNLPDVGGISSDSVESLKGLVIYDDLKHQLRVGERALSSRSFGQVNYARDPLVDLRRRYPQLEWHLIQVPTPGSATYEDDARLLSEAEQASLRYLMKDQVDPDGAGGKIVFNYTRDDRGRVVYQTAYVMFIAKEVAQRARLQRARLHLSAKDNMRNTVLEESRERGHRVQISSSTPEEDTVNLVVPEDVIGPGGSEE